MKIEVRDQVLLLLPDQDTQKKFTRKWQCPFKIKQKLGQVNYEVIIDSEGNTKVYHINLLKKWFPHTETFSSYANTIEEDANMKLYEQSDQQTPQINQELSGDQKSQLLKLIQKYPTLTTSLPGCTTQKGTKRKCRWIVKNASQWRSVLRTRRRAEECYEAD